MVRYKKQYFVLQLVMGRVVAPPSTTWSSKSTWMPENRKAKPHQEPRRRNKTGYFTIPIPILIGKYLDNVGWSHNYFD